MRQYILIIMPIMLFFTACTRQPTLRCENGLKINGANVENCHCKPGYYAKYSYSTLDIKGFQGFECQNIINSTTSNRQFVIAFDEYLNNGLNSFKYSLSVDELSFYDTAWTFIPNSITHTRNIFITKKDDYNKVIEGYKLIIYGKLSKFGPPFGPAGPLLEDTVHLDLRELGDIGYTDNGEGIFIAYKQSNDSSKYVIPNDRTKALVNFTINITAPGDSTSFNAVRKLPIRNLGD